MNNPEVPVTWVPRHWDDRHRQYDSFYVQLYTQTIGIADYDFSTSLHRFRLELDEAHLIDLGYSREQINDIARCATYLYRCLTTLGTDIEMAIGVFDAIMNGELAEV